MQIVILAGGLGTRLWPLTKEVPKPMVPVAGVPYLEHQLRLLAQQELTDIVLLTGYLGEQIEAHFGDGHPMGLRIRYSRERTPVGTGGALREARELIDDPFVVMYGDSYLPIEYRAVGETLMRKQAEGVLTLCSDPSGETGVNKNVAVDRDGWVVEYRKSQTPDPKLVYIDAGVMALRRSVLERIPPAGPVSFEQQVFPQLIEQKKLYGMPVGQRFYDIGTPERLKVIEALLA